MLWELTICIVVLAGMSKENPDSFSHREPFKRKQISRKVHSGQIEIVLVV